MKININYEDEAFRKDEYEQVIERVCDEAALVYGLGPNAEISILLCHNDYIHKLNKQYRNIDRPTDVLSFALNEGEDDGYDGLTGHSSEILSFHWKKCRNRPKNTAILSNGNWRISPSTACSTSWDTITWNRMTKLKCAKKRNLSSSVWGMCAKERNSDGR